MTGHLTPAEWLIVAWLAVMFGVTLRIVLEALAPRRRKR